MVSQLLCAVFWEAFIMEFSPNSVRCSMRPLLIECKDILAQKGVFIDQDRALTQADAIIDVIYRSTHIATGKGLVNETVHTYTTYIQACKGDVMPSEGRPADDTEQRAYAKYAQKVEKPNDEMEEPLTICERPRVSPEEIDRPAVMKMTGHHRAYQNSRTSLKVRRRSHPHTETTSSYHPIDDTNGARRHDNH